MKNPNPVRIGIIGMGEHMMRAHVAFLGDHPDAKLVSWFDPKPSKEVLRSPHIVPSEQKGSEEDIYGDPNVDAVMIGSPDEYHVDQFCAAINAGKHVFCEKPMWLDRVGMAKMARAFNVADEKKLVISSCHPRRFDPPILAIRDRLLDPEWVDKFVGKIEHFEFNFWYHEVTEDWKVDRSLLLDHFGHELDTFRFLFPQFDNPAQLWEAKMVSDAYDHYHTTLQTTVKGGPNMTASFRGYRSLDEKDYIETIRIVGTKGTVFFHLSSGEVFMERSAQMMLSRIPEISYDERHSAVTADFIGAVKTGSSPYLSHVDMFRNNTTAHFILSR